MVRRHDALGKSVLPIGVFTGCLIGEIGEQNFLDTQTQTFASLKNPLTVLYGGCRISRFGSHELSLPPEVVPAFLDELSWGAVSCQLSKKVITRIEKMDEWSLQHKVRERAEKGRFSAAN